MRQKLNTDLLRYAYAQGYFPMPDQKTQEIFWFFPDPRAIIPLDGFKCSRSLMRSLRNRGYRVSFDKVFDQVIKACSERAETWINDEFIKIYTQLFREGDAHSVEVWKDEALVGGVYGVSIAGAFFAESKFHRATDASKVALYYLVERMRHKNMELLEVQFMTPHLRSLGAVEVAADYYKELLTHAVRSGVNF